MRLLFLLLLPSLCVSLEYVWQISDIHVDDNYVATGAPHTWCHEDERKEEKYFGQRGCGLPWRTVQLAIDFMRDTIQNPDAVIWTGDTAPNWPYKSWDAVFPKLRRVTSMLRTAFPEAQIIPSIGNHDAYPSDYFPSNNVTFFERYLIESGWNEVLPESARATFRKGGYYRVDVHNVRYLVLNTPLYYHRNSLTRDDDGRDPTGQLAWLKEQLLEPNQPATVVTGHIAPGFPHWSIYQMQLRGNENHQLLRILRNGMESRIANIFGHEHIDTFKNQYRSDLTFDQHTSALNTFFLAPSLIPGTLTQDINPSVRIYVFREPQHAMVNDLIQNHMDIEAANAAHRRNPTIQGRDFWKLTYRMRELYGLGDLSRSAMHQFFKELKTDEEKFNKYYKMTGGNHANVPTCNSTCRTQHLCTMSALDSQAMAECLSGTGASATNVFMVMLAMLMSRIVV